MVQIEGDFPCKESLTAIGRGRRVDFAAVRQLATKVIEFGMGNHPPFVVKHKGIVSAGIAGKHDKPFVSGENVKRQFHQMPVIQ